VTRREELKAALAKAEANLGKAITNSTKAGTNRVDANAIIDKARAYCRLAHAALIKSSVRDQ